MVLNECLTSSNNDLVISLPYAWGTGTGLPMHKPATETALVARVLCQCIWDAGVPRQAVQLVVCDGPDASRYLLSSPQVAACVFTGGTDTAKRILAARPELHLLAETGGKNATIVSSLSDRDLAIKNILHSAFSHAGQKCR
jgi:RHH-type transcriptional regulator, proline utilization regulon repressor / proline dehydrogenase / delta 1-pyrroline-5-carboxylate dehydrogenase